MLQDANKQNAKMLNINPGFYLVQILKAGHLEAIFRIPIIHLYRVRILRLDLVPLNLQNYNGS